MDGVKNFKLSVDNTTYAGFHALTRTLLGRVDDGDRQLTPDEFGKLDRDNDRLLTTDDIYTLLSERQIKELGISKDGEIAPEILKHVAKDLLTIPFSNRTFFIKFDSVEALKAKRMSQGYKCHWYKILDGAYKEHLKSFNKFITGMEKIFAHYNKTGTIDIETRNEVLGLAVDNYTDIFSFLPGLFSELEKERPDEEKVERSLFLVNHSLNYFGKKSISLRRVRSRKGHYKIVINGWRDITRQLAELMK